MVETYLKDFTLLLICQAVIFNAYDLFVRKSLLQCLWQKYACIGTLLLAPITFTCDTRSTIIKKMSQKEEEGFTGLCLERCEERIIRYKRLNVRGIYE